MDWLLSRVKIMQISLYVLPDDDKRYAIESCRSSESVIK